MGEKRIKWGNILILLLIVAAAAAAFYYKPLKSPKNEEAKSQSDIKKESEKGNASGKENTASDNEFIMALDSWIGGTPALMALSREYNKDYDLNLKLEYIPNDEDRIVALKNGKIQATEVSLPSFLRLQNKYPDAGVIVGITDFSRGADGIVAKADVKSLNDMEGKRISFVGDGTGKFILNKFLRLTGLRYQDIQPIERKEMQEVVDDLKSGRADMIVSWSPDMNLVVKDVNAKNPGSVKLLITTKEVPSLVPTVLVVNKSFYKNNNDKTLAFLKTWYASCKYIIERPEKAYEKLSQLMNERNEEYGEVTVADVKESFANIKLMSLKDNYEYFGLNGKDKPIETIINDTAQTWKKYGDLSKNISIPEALSYGLMEQLNKENDRELQVEVADSGMIENGKQNGEVKKEFKKQDDTSIEKNTEKVAKIDIPPVYYDPGKATVKTESITVLNEVLNILKQFPEYYLIIDAHTDTVGSGESNLKLSRDRAMEVSKYLVSQGVDINRIVSRGWGETKLVMIEEKTEEDKAKNRRTEFILTRDAAR